MPKRVKHQSNIGTLIKTHRKLLNLTQEQLAEKLNVSFQQIQKYEYDINKPSIDIAIKLCKVLKIPSEKMFGESQTADLLREVEKEIVNNYDIVKIIKNNPKLRDIIKFYDNNKESLSNVNLLKLLTHLSKSSDSKKKLISQIILKIDK